MKQIIFIFKNFFIIITALCFILTSNCFSMVFRGKNQSKDVKLAAQEQAMLRKKEALTSARQEKLRKELQSHKNQIPLKSKTSNATSVEKAIIFIKTQDNRIVTADEWMIKNMPVLHLFLLHQHGKNSSENPIDGSHLITSESLSLLSDAFNELAKGTFDDYYNKLDQEYKRTLTPEGKDIGEGQLRKLINAAETVQAKQLSALLLSKFISKDLQENITPKEIVSPVCTYLKKELLLHETKKTAKKQILLARLT